MEALPNMTTTNPYYFPVVIVPLLCLGLSTKVGKPVLPVTLPFKQLLVVKQPWIRSVNPHSIIQQPALSIGRHVDKLKEAVFQDWKCVQPAIITNCPFIVWFVFLLICVIRWSRFYIPRTISQCSITNEWPKGAWICVVIAHCNSWLNLHPSPFQQL